MITSDNTLGIDTAMEIGENPPETPNPGVDPGPVGETPIQTLFPEVTQLRLCSANVCLNGHEWIPKVALARCGHGTPQGWNGCGAPVLAVKYENCPTCNEPVKFLRLRSDHTPPTQFPIPICIPGSHTNAEVCEIRIQRNHEEFESRYDKKFPPFPASKPEPTKEEIV